MKNVTERAQLQFAKVGTKIFIATSHVTGQEKGENDISAMTPEIGVKSYLCVD
jgi:hypothetical protein